jgi:hypothetical protein
MLRRYIILLVLHEIGYRGSVVDPGRLTGWAGDADLVPWVAGSTLPPMPPDKRTIREERRSARQPASNRRGRPGQRAGRRR